MVPLFSYDLIGRQHISEKNYKPLADEYNLAIDM